MITNLSDVFDENNNKNLNNFVITNMVPLLDNSNNLVLITGSIISVVLTIH